METMDAIRDSAREDLRDRFKDYREEFGDAGRYEPHDVIHEIADGHVPVYTSDRLEAIASDVNVACRELELAGPDMDMVALAGVAIYEDLSETLWDEWRDIEVELEDEDEDEDEEVAS